MPKTTPPTERFQMELLIKGCSLQFKEGFSPGGFATQVVSFNQGQKPGLGAMKQAALLELIDKFIRENVEVRVTAILEEQFQAMPDKEPLGTTALPG
jgi:hypothetical protein